MKERCPRCGSSVRWMRYGKCRVCGNDNVPPTLTEPWRVLLSLPGVSVEIARALYDRGFKSIAAIKAASDNELLAIPGIGPVRAAKIRGLMVNDN